MAISPSQIFAKIKESEIVARLEPETSEKLLNEAGKMFKAAVAERSPAAKNTLLEGIAYQAKLRSTAELTKRYPVFN